MGYKEDFIGERSLKFLHGAENHITMTILTVIALVPSMQENPIYWWNLPLVIWTFVMIMILSNDSKLF